LQVNKADFEGFLWKWQKKDPEFVFEHNCVGVLAKEKRKLKYLIRLMAFFSQNWFKKLCRIKNLEIFEPVNLKKR
jgi:hypothetical protein